MAVVYWDTGRADDTGDGSTWALAKKTLGAAITAAGASGTIYGKNTNNQAHTGSALTITFLSGQKLISVSDTGEPPTTPASGAIVSTDAQHLTVICDTTLFVYGVAFKCGISTTGGFDFKLYSASATNGRYVFDTCQLRCESDNGAGLFEIQEGITSAPTFVFRNTNLHCYKARIELWRGPFVEMYGGSVTTSNTSGSAFYGGATNQGYDLRLYGVDFSGIPAGASIASGTYPGRIIAADCVMPASWTGSLLSSSGNYARAEGINITSTSNDYNYEYRLDTYSGNVIVDGGIYLDSGITDGAKSLSYRLASNANCDKHQNRFLGPEFHVWNDTTGSSKTATVQIVHNSQGSGTDGVLLDTEVWLEVMYLGTSGYPLGTYKVARYDGTLQDSVDVLATGTAHTTSSSTWTGDSAGWDTQKLTATFTPQEKGVFVARVCMGVASKTVYVDPNVIIT